jgi:hypothetical protein
MISLWVTFSRAARHLNTSHTQPARCAFTCDGAEECGLAAAARAVDERDAAGVHVRRVVPARPQKFHRLRACAGQSRTTHLALSIQRHREEGRDAQQAW